MRKKFRFAGLFLAGFSVFALAGCGNSANNSSIITVIFDSNGGSEVDSQTTTDGYLIEPTDPTKDGFIFAGWYEDEALTNEFLFDSETVKGDTTLYAKWDEKTKLVVTFESNGGSSVSSQQVREGGFVVEPTEPTKSGYKFGGWYSDSSLTNKWDFKTNTVNKETTLYAKWDTYTVEELIEEAAKYSSEASKERFVARVTVDEIIDAKTGEMNVSDDTGTIYVWGSRNSDGSQYFEDIEDKPISGDEILISADLQTFKGTPEIHESWILEVKHSQGDFDIDDYESMSVNEARDEAKGAKVLLNGVVSQFTYNSSKVATGFILVDNTSSIYVFDMETAMQVEIGNKIQIAGTRDNWILEKEESSAEKWGYDGCIQLTETHLISNDNGDNSWDKSWVKESTVKKLLDVDPAKENITTEIYKVNALVKKQDGSGFVNYYFNDLDGTTGSYTYSQANGSDFEWLNEFDGKICTVYLMVINYKAEASGVIPRLLPIEVKDENFEFNPQNGAQFVLDYYVEDLFDVDTYYANPNLEVPTSATNSLIGIDNAKITYKSSDESVIKFNEVKGVTYMDVLNFDEKDVTITAEATYAGVTAKLEKVIHAKDVDLLEYTNVKGAIGANLESEVSVRAIVGPSLVNRDGFYLIDDTGVIAVTTDTKTLGQLNVGDEVVLHGTRTQFNKIDEQEKPGQSCILDAVIDVNLYGNNEYSTKTFENKTFDELLKLDYKEDLTNKVYYVKAKVVVVETDKYTRMDFVDPNDSTKTLKLYSSSANQYKFLFDYADKVLTYAVAPCNWNKKNYYAFCVLNVQLEDGTIINNELNFESNR